MDVLTEHLVCLGYTLQTSKLNDQLARTSDIVIQWHFENNRNVTIVVFILFVVMVFSFFFYNSRAGVRNLVLSVCLSVCLCLSTSLQVVLEVWLRVWTIM